MLTINIKNHGLLKSALEQLKRTSPLVARELDAYKLVFARRSSSVNGVSSHASPSRAAIQFSQRSLSRLREPSAPR